MPTRSSVACRGGQSARRLDPSGDVALRLRWRRHLGVRPRPPFVRWVRSDEPMVGAKLHVWDHWRDSLDEGPPTDTGFPFPESGCEPSGLPQGFELRDWFPCRVGREDEGLDPASMAVHPMAVCSSDSDRNGWNGAPSAPSTGSSSSRMGGARCWLVTRRPTSSRRVSWISMETVPPMDPGDHHELRRRLAGAPHGLRWRAIPRAPLVRCRRHRRKLRRAFRSRACLRDLERGRSLQGPGAQGPHAPGTQGAGNLSHGPGEGSASSRWAARMGAFPSVAPTGIVWNPPYQVAGREVSRLHPPEPRSCLGFAAFRGVMLATVLGALAACGSDAPRGAPRVCACIGTPPGWGRFCVSIPSTVGAFA